MGNRGFFGFSNPRMDYGYVVTNPYGIAQNYIKNGNFDNSLSYWRTEGLASITLMNGSFCRISRNGVGIATKQCYQPMVGLLIGKLYQLTVNFMSKSTESLGLTAVFLAASQIETMIIDNVLTPGILQFTFSPNFTSGELVLKVVGNTYGTVDVDDVSVFLVG
jgi:hypothetical protein